METNLYIKYYQDPNDDRQKELEFCILENCKNQLFNNIFILSRKENINSCFLKNIYYQKNNISLVEIEEKPTYNFYFSLFKENCINLFSNLDIIIPPETISLVPKYFEQNKKRCLALTRYDIYYIEDYKSNNAFFNRADSQDVWIFYGTVPQLENANFTLGRAGCDNSIAYILEQNGYDVINPSFTLKTYHYHLTNLRYYLSLPAIPPPYKILQPCH